MCPQAGDLGAVVSVQVQTQRPENQGSQQCPSQPESEDQGPGAPITEQEKAGVPGLVQSQLTPAFLFRPSGGIGPPTWGGVLFVSGSNANLSEKQLRHTQK